MKNMKHVLVRINVFYDFASRECYKCYFRFIGDGRKNTGTSQIYESSSEATVEL